MAQPADRSNSDAAARAEVRWVAGAAIAAIAFFVVFPQADLVVARWFYTPNAGFELRNNAAVQALYVATLWIPRALLLLLFVGTMLSLMARSGWLHVHRRQLVFLFVASALGAGVTVNWVLKEHWGRARPQSIVEFGGTAHYTAPFMVTRECSRNCAFTSGHAASGFSLLAFGRLRRARPGRARLRWLAIGLATGLLVGLARIAQGAHFPSDVLFSFFVVYAAIEVTDRCCRWLSSLRRQQVAVPEPT